MRAYAYVRTFNEPGDFAALNAAKAWAEAMGFSIGRLCRPHPIGLLYGKGWDIAKWKNMTAQQRHDLHGTITGGRDAPVVVKLKVTIPDEALVRVIDDGTAYLGDAE